MTSTAVTSPSTARNTASPRGRRNSGEYLPIIGQLLGHNKVQTSSRYALFACDSVSEPAEQIFVSIAPNIL